MMVIDSSICQGQFAYVSMTWRHIQSKIYLVNVKRKIKPHPTTWLINAVQTTDKTTYEILKTVFNNLFHHLYQFSAGEKKQKKP